MGPADMNYDEFFTADFIDEVKEANLITIDSLSGILSRAAPLISKPLISKPSVSPENVFSPICPFYFFGGGYKSTISLDEIRNRKFCLIDSEASFKGADDWIQAVCAVIEAPAPKPKRHSRWELLD